MIPPASPPSFGPEGSTLGDIGLTEGQEVRVVVTGHGTTPRRPGRPTVGRLGPGGRPTGEARPPGRRLPVEVRDVWVRQVVRPQGRGTPGTGLPILRDDVQVSRPHAGGSEVVSLMNQKSSETDQETSSPRGHQRTNQTPKEHETLSSLSSRSGLPVLPSTSLNTLDQRPFRWPVLSRDDSLVYTSHSPPERHPLVKGSARVNRRRVSLPPPDPTGNRPGEPQARHTNLVEQ